MVSFSIITNNAGLILAGAAGIAVVSYAIYFDHKRRTAPGYKDSIRRNRKRKQAQMKNSSSGALNVDFPDPRNPVAGQTFLFEQISMGETLLENGRIEEAVIHLSNAAIASGQPAELLQIFQQTIPPEAFMQLVNAIPAAKMRQQSSIQKHYGGAAKVIDIVADNENNDPIKDELDLE